MFVWLLCRESRQFQLLAALERSSKRWARIVKCTDFCDQAPKMCVTMVAPLPPMFCAMASRALGT